MKPHESTKPFWRSSRTSRDIRVHVRDAIQ
jgi:hypothetical protein